MKSSGSIADTFAILFIWNFSANAKRTVAPSTRGIADPAWNVLVHVPMTLPNKSTVILTTKVSFTLITLLELAQMP